MVVCRSSMRKRGHCSLKASLFAVNSAFQYPCLLNTGKHGDDMGIFDWNAVSAIAEIIGVAGLIGSLIFVGVQMKQTALAIKVNTNHGVQEAFRDINLRVATDEGLASIFHRELPVAGTVEGLDQFRFSLTNQAMIQLDANAHYQRRIGALELETWDSIDAQLGNLLKAPGMRAYWETRGSNYPKEFANYINSDVMTSSQQESYRIAGT